MTQQQGTTAGVPPERGAAVDDGAPPWPRLVIVAAAFVAGCAAVYWFGLDSIWPMVTGGVISAALAFGADVAISRLGGRIERHIRWAQVAAVLVLGLVVALFYRAERLSTFEKVFGTAPPAGVRHVDVHRLVGSDTGKKLTILQFECDRAALDRLVGTRRFSERPVPIRPGREAKAQRGVWSSAFIRYGDSVTDRWKNRLPVTEPVIFHWTGLDKETLGQQASVLWDAASGRGCAIHASS